MPTTTDTPDRTVEVDRQRGTEFIQRWDGRHITISRAGIPRTAIIYRPLAVAIWSVTFTLEGYPPVELPACGCKVELLELGVSFVEKGVWPTDTTFQKLLKLQDAGKVLEQKVFEQYERRTGRR